MLFAAKKTNPHTPHGHPLTTTSKNGEILTECPMSVKNVTKTLKKNAPFSIQGLNIFVIAAVAGCVGVVIKMEILKIHGTGFNQAFVGLILTFFILAGISIFMKEKSETG